MVVGQAVRIKSEEIVVQDLTDVEQDAGINTPLIVNLVDIGAVTAQLIGQTDRGSALPFQFRFYAHIPMWSGFLPHSTEPHCICVPSGASCRPSKTTAAQPRAAHTHLAL